MTGTLTTPDRIAVDPTLQPRVNGLDTDHVRALQEAPEAWPPLVVVSHQGKWLLVDGFHRLAAAQNLGLNHVRVQVVDLPSDSDLHAFAFRLNAAHGRPLSLPDRRAFAERLLRQHSDWADREIARRCGLSSNTVGSLRERLERAAQIEQTETRVGAGGYSYTVGTNERQRQPGELPETGIGTAMGDAVGRLFTSTERIQQRRIARYLERLAVALEDQDRLDGWARVDDIADACVLVLGHKQARVLAQRLGRTCHNVLSVALALGYEEPNR